MNEKIINLIWVSNNVKFEPYNEYTGVSCFYWIRMEDGKYYSSRDGLEGIKNKLKKGGYSFFVAKDTSGYVN